MNQEMQQILIDIFPLIVEVNFNTEYRVNFNIQPTFDDYYQIWYQVSLNPCGFNHTHAAFWDDESKFKQRMAEFKNKLLKILGRD
jgi:hypothetical protein